MTIKIHKAFTATQDMDRAKQIAHSLEMSVLTDYNVLSYINTVYRSAFEGDVISCCVEVASHQLGDRLYVTIRLHQGVCVLQVMAVFTTDWKAVYDSVLTIRYKPSDERAKVREGQEC